MSYKAIYTYAWDLAEAGVSQSVQQFRDLGLDTVTIAGSYAYVADGEKGLRIVDVGWLVHEVTRRRRGPGNERRAAVFATARDAVHRGEYGAAQHLRAHVELHRGVVAGRFVERGVAEVGR